MKNHNKTMDIKAITAKQIPDMSDDELQQAITHYGPKHARTAKLTKEANRRALVSKIKAKPQPTNGALPPALSAKLQEAHKAHGHDVTQATVQRAYDQALKEVTTGEGSNGGVKYKIKPTQMQELKQKLKRLENDLSLVGIQPTESTSAQTDQTQPQQEKQQATLAAAVNSDGINDHIRALRAVASKSIKQGGPRGDVRLSTDPSLYVPFEAAVAEARKAVANGVKPVPFQIHDALDIGIGETDRVIAALSAPVAPIVTPQLPPAATLLPSSGVKSRYLRT